MVDDLEIERIKKQGCCLGKYRILLSDGYYCILDNVFDCPHQEKTYIQLIDREMSVCKTNQKKPCEECAIYNRAENNRLKDNHEINAV
jgi:hypothetical protein